MKAERVFTDASNFITDDRGADTLPVALVATVLILALIVGFAAVGVKNLAPVSDSASVDRQARAFAADCQSLLSLAPGYLDDPSSPPGAAKIVEFDLPGSTEYFSFGLDPESGEGNEGTLYYRAGSSKKAIVIDTGVRFRECGDGGLISVLEGNHLSIGPGKSRLSFEHAVDSCGNRYLLISSVGLRCP